MHFSERGLRGILCAGGPSCAARRGRVGGILIKTSDFYYELPPELIAQTPTERRDASRLLVLDRETGAMAHRHFYDLPQYLRAGDCLVLNDSRVLPARLIGHRAPGGGTCEVVLLIDRGEKTWECLVRPGKKLRPGARMTFGDGKLTAEVVEVLEGGNRLVRFDYEGIFLELLEELGRMPLPPYIKAELQDPERYQTVYSREVGSAAAPTAGLHFTKELLASIEAMGVRICYVTLHVGLGTFRPVKVEDDVVPDDRELGGGGRDAARERGLDEDLHLSGLPVQGARRADHELPSAGVHPRHARLGAGRAGPHHGGLRGGRAPALPVLLLRRRDGDPAGHRRKRIRKDGIPWKKS